MGRMKNILENISVVVGSCPWQFSAQVQLNILIFCCPVPSTRKIFSNKGARLYYSQFACISASTDSLNFL